MWRNISAVDGPTPINFKQCATHIWYHMISLIISVSCLSLISLEEEVPCMLYVTKLAVSFSYIILYGLQLSTALIVLIILSLIIRTTVKHNRQIRDTSVTNASSTKETQSCCPPVIWRSFVHIIWICGTRTILIIMTQTYFLNPTVITMNALHIMYAFVYLSSSSFPLFYICASTKFRMSLLEKMKTLTKQTK